VSSSRLARPKAAGGAAAAATGALWRTAVVSLVTAGVVAGGTWGLLTPRDAHDEGHAGHAAASVATLSLPDGTLRVDGLVDKQVGHVMAGMSTAQDVPPGMRRLAVNVSLGATGDRPLTYGLRDFTVSGPGVQPVVPAPPAGPPVRRR